MKQFPTDHEGLVIPERIKALPRDKRGYPVPWFVYWDDKTGEPLFPVADADKRVSAVKDRLCYVCGQKLGRYLAFVLGPMCTITRTTAEPAVHVDCGIFSAQACPFLVHPNEKRVPNKWGAESSGHAIMRNPGVMAVWTTTTFRVFRDGRGGWLISVGDPTEVRWFREGRPATRFEILKSIHCGLPALRAIDPGNPAAQEALEKKFHEALKYLPSETDEPAPSLRCPVHQPK